MKTVRIGNVELGQGKPKVCVPVMGRDARELQQACRALDGNAFDLVEWRADYLDDAYDHEAVLDAFELLKQELGQKPVIFTFRTKGEGGQKPISYKDYEALLMAVAASGLANAIDVEFFIDCMVADLVAALKDGGCTVIGSNHDFAATPPVIEMDRRLSCMRNGGCDVVKIAVTPQDGSDVLNLMQATLMQTQRADAVPTITMSMGALGVASRVCGEFMGSCMTFGAVGAASAPGQLPANSLNAVLDVLHEGGQG